MKAAGLSAKESMQLAKENRKIKILNIPKKNGGLFTSSEEIGQYMEHKIANQIKQQRMKNKVTYTRDSTRSIPAAVTPFRIIKTDPTTKKRKVLTACEFAENLKLYLGGKITNLRLLWVISCWHSGTIKIWFSRPKLISCLSFILKLYTFVYD